MNWRFNKAIWRLLPGSVITLFFAGMMHLGALQPLEQIAYQILFRLRGEIPWDDRLVLVAIDNTSINQLGRFPWSRRAYVKLLNTLTPADAGIVAIDLLWSESSPDDAQLAQAIARNGRVVLAQAHDGNGLPLLPVPLLQGAAIATGHISVKLDADGLVRKVNLQTRDGLALGVAAVQAYSLMYAPVPLPDLHQPLWINWSGRAKTLQQYSFVDVIQAKIPPQAFRNKIVLVGVTATGFDPMLTPFDRNPPASGVYLNAVVTNTLLQQNPLKPLSPQGLWLLLILGGPTLSYLLSDRHELHQWLIWVGICLGWCGVSLMLFQLNYWLPVALPLGLYSFTTVAVILTERLKAAAMLQEQIKNLWWRHQQDLITPVAPAKSAGDLVYQSPAGLVQSITQLTSLADQFARSQSAQAAIARSLSMGVLAADIDGMVWFCNPVATAWLQVDVGHDLKEHLVPDWLTEDEWRSDLQTLQTQNPVASRQHHRGDRWFELKLEPLTYHPDLDCYEPHSVPNGVLVVLEDITAKKTVEAALAQQVQELERVAQLKDDFLSTVSHELRSPMTNIKMAIELLKVSRSEVSSNHYLDILQTECRREIDLINDLLDLQRLEANAQIYTGETINLHDWLPPIVNAFSERAESQQQSLELELPPQLPIVVSERQSLERIMVELINNACKYTPPGSEIKVAANWAPPYLMLTVENSGIEIPTAELPRIFEKFYRVPQSDPWKRGGTGLGLALVTKLVDYLGGVICVSSQSGRTTFTIQLPIAD